MAGAPWFRKPAALLIAQSIVGAQDKKGAPGEEELWSSRIWA